MQTSNRHHANAPSIATRSHRARMAAAYPAPAANAILSLARYTAAVLTFALIVGAL